ncbi:hypothetical protein J4210_00265 [Candidatus Woesearchaeota archaeon]|nr:hypothetical protein [Candidatus Woesearchaeota archaeon]
MTLPWRTKNILTGLTVLLIGGLGFSSASTLSTNSLNKNGIDRLVLGTFKYQQDVPPCADPDSINVRSIGDSKIGDSKYAVYCGDDELDFSCRIEKSVFPEDQPWYFMLSTTPIFSLKGSCNSVLYGQK